MNKPLDDTHGPIVPEMRIQMQALARGIDEILNEDLKNRTTGFALIVFPFGDAENPSRDRMNYISNADRLDMKTMFKEMLARWEGFPTETTKVKQ